ncbi:hypothetical protein Ddye_007845 [Dipteronia dyeriana]|uniref:Uncharacterized protein n=1 Tax=Dipteronia dyeriana TaxID=168575 RepID=A0AAD9XL06_9ROSI|nr:hypothetical protein Ddye_007845 [Dipteronia dyeriana]
MGRAPCCDKTKVKRGPWSPEEDSTLIRFLETHGTAGNWIALPQKAGLKRCGKSCRLRWLNYLRPNIKHGNFTKDEDEIICTLYTQMGSRWSIIASNLPGRTDNDVKNYWNTKLKKKLLAGKVIGHTTTNNYITSNNFLEKSCNRKNPHDLLDSSISTTPSSTYDHHHHNHLLFPSQPQIIFSSPPPFPILTDHMGYGSSTVVDSTHEISLMSSDPTTLHFSHHGHVSEFSTNLKNSSSSIFTSSQDGGSSSVSVSADSSSLAMENNNNINKSLSGLAVEDEGGILMDFSFGIGGPIYNEFTNSTSSGIWFQDQKASHDIIHQEAALSYCCYPNLGDHQSSSYADIKPPPQGLINQSVINQY